MKLKLLRAIAMFRPDRAGIAGKTPRTQTGLPFGTGEMAAAGLIAEPLLPDGRGRTGRHAGPVGAGIAGVRAHGPRGHEIVGDGREGKRTAIAMPEAVIRMDENAERRGPEPFGPHGPLLERLPGRIGGKEGGCTMGRGNRGNHRPGPVVQRFGRQRAPMPVAPATKESPEGASHMPYQQHHGRWPVGECRPVSRKGNRAAQRKPVRRKRRTDCPDCPGAAQRGPLYS